MLQGEGAVHGILQGEIQRVPSVHAPLVSTHAAGALSGHCSGGVTRHAATHASGTLTRSKDGAGQLRPVRLNGTGEGWTTRGGGSRPGTLL